MSREHNSDIRNVEKLFRLYFKSLKTYSVRIVYDPNVAEDIVQDVFFELWQNRKSIEFDGSVKAYLFKSVYNRSLNYLKSKAYLTQTSLNDAFESQILDSYLISMQNNQEENLIMKEVQAEIDAAIDELPPQCQKVFKLSRTFELKNREIAEQLDISVKAVEKHMTRALSQIHKHLKSKGILVLLLLFFC